MTYFCYHHTKARLDGENKGVNPYKPYCIDASYKASCVYICIYLCIYLYILFFNIALFYFVMRVNILIFIFAHVILFKSILKRFFFYLHTNYDQNLAKMAAK